MRTVPAMTRFAVVLLAALAALGGLAGCGGSPEPPDSCPWAASPEGVLADDVAGRYQGTNADGKPITVELSADGRFTAANLKVRDWLTGTWLDVESPTTWRLDVDRKWYHRFVDDPPPATVHLSDRAETGLRVGGTRKEPVLYDILDQGASCDEVRSLLRKAP